MSPSARYVSERYDAARHDVDSFASGQPSLDDWLREHAGTATAKNVAATFVWCPEDTTRVIGYYSLCAHVISRDEMPKKLGRGDPAQIPAVLLARLALDQQYQGSGTGGALLAECLQRAARAAEDVAAQYVVVDAIDKSAADFYRHYGFADTPAAGRLVCKISSIRASLRTAGRITDR